MKNEELEELVSEIVNRKYEAVSLDNDMMIEEIAALLATFNQPIGRSSFPPAKGREGDKNKELEERIETILMSHKIGMMAKRDKLLSLFDEYKAKDWKERA